MRTVVAATVVALLAAITPVPAQESGSGSEETILIDLLALDDVDLMLRQLQASEVRFPETRLQEGRQLIP